MKQLGRRAAADGHVGLDLVVAYRGGHRAPKRTELRGGLASRHGPLYVPRMNVVRPLSLFVTTLALSIGCQTPTLTIDRPTTSATFKAEAPAVLEPIFEETELERFSQSSSAGQVTTTVMWEDKIWLVKPEQRRRMHQAMLPVLAQAGIVDTAKLRAGALTGHVRVVRLTLASYKKVDENLLPLYACYSTALSPLCPPLVFAGLVPLFVPLTTAEKIDVVAKVYDVDTATLKLIDSPGADFPFVDVSTSPLIAQQRYESPWKTESGLFNRFNETTLGSVLDQQFSPTLADVAKDILGKAGTPPPAAEAPGNVF
jgi:hypothetical protein